MRVRFAVAVLIACVLLGRISQADPQTWTAFEQIVTTGTEAHTLSASNIQAGSGHPQANYASCTVHENTTNGQIAYRWDGTAPTSTTGTLADPGTTITLQGHVVLGRFQFVRAGSANAQLDCHEWN